MRSKSANQGISKPEFKMSPADERWLRERGHGGLLRKLKRSARGESTPQSRAFVKSYRTLAAKFRTSSRKADSKLAVLTAVWLVEVVEYANQLSKRLERIKRTSGRTTRHDARLEICMAYDIELWLLRRRVEWLWRNIPRLIERLGGDPSEYLMSRRKRVPTKPGPPHL